MSHSVNPSTLTKLHGRLCLHTADNAAVEWLTLRHPNANKNFRFVFHLII